MLLGARLGQSGMIHCHGQFWLYLSWDQAAGRYQTYQASVFCRALPFSQRVVDLSLRKCQDAIGAVFNILPSFHVAGLRASRFIKICSICLLEGFPN